jgi:hypothetical protein
MDLITIYLDLFEELQRLAIRASHQEDDESVAIAMSAIAHLQKLRRGVVVITFALTFLFILVHVLAK